MDEGEGERGILTARREATSVAKKSNATDDGKELSLVWACGKEEEEEVISTCACGEGGGAKKKLSREGTEEGGE